MWEWYTELSKVARGIRENPSRSKLGDAVPAPLPPLCVLSLFGRRWKRMCEVFSKAY
jgi:hypothetical protein